MAWQWVRNYAIHSPITRCRLISVGVCRVDALVNVKPWPIMGGEHARLCYYDHMQAALSCCAKIIELVSHMVWVNLPTQHIPWDISACIIQTFFPYKQDFSSRTRSYSFYSNLMMMNRWKETERTLILIITSSAWILLP